MDNIIINTFLFAWNPIKFAWPEIKDLSEQLKRGKKVTEDWSCASHKKIKKGDRAFLSLVGVEPRGIFASGYVASEPFIGKNKRGKENYRVLIEFDVLLNPDKETILTLDIIKIGKLEKQQWTPQASGISIKPEITEELEALWQDFLTGEHKSH
ncbi:MAG: hypothetical protein V4506_14625 [Bacteroidota bacterium]